MIFTSIIITSYWIESYSLTFVMEEELTIHFTEVTSHLEKFKIKVLEVHGLASRTKTLIRLCLHGISCKLELAP